MPYTRRQVRYLLSKVSPLTPDEQAKVKAELHSDPNIGHGRKGSAAMKRGPNKAKSWRHKGHVVSRKK